MKKVKQYIQEKDVIHHVQDYLQGSKVLIMLGSFNADVFKEKIVSSITIPYECIVTDAECTQSYCEMLAHKMREEKFDSIIGFGGGKIVDIAKAVTHYYSCFLMVIPSSASMDGACSALSVLYHDDHRFDRFIELPNHPDVVLVDSQIIFDAPFSLLCAGMVDALSSYYDTRYVLNTNDLAKEVIRCSQNCYDAVYGLYEEVKNDFEKRNFSASVETIIRTNIYDSAIAFENAGCEFSHVLANATTNVKGSKGMHGERVGVATLFQLALEKDTVEFKKLKQLLLALHMPISLEQLQVHDKQVLISSIEKEFKELKIKYDYDSIIEALQCI